MFKICGLRRGLDSAVQLAVDKNFYLRLIVEKIYAFAVFNDKYLQPYGCSDPNFTATVKYKLKNWNTKWNHRKTNYWNANRLCNKASISPLLVTNIFVVHWHSYKLRTEPTILIKNTLKKYKDTKKYWKPWPLTFIFDIYFFYWYLSWVILFQFHMKNVL